MPIATPTMRAERGAGGTSLHANILPPPRPKWFHPFKIYQVAPFTFQIRGGFVGCRPRHVVPSDTQLFGNNYEYRLDLITGGADGGGEGSLTHTDLGFTTDFYTRGAVETVDETVNIGNTGDSTVSDITHSAKWHLNETNDNFCGPAASFWIQIDDSVDDALPTAQIYARMVTGNGLSSLGRTDQMYPSNAIHIGFVVQGDGQFGAAVPSDPSKLVIFNEADHHITSREPWYANDQFPFKGTGARYLGMWSDADFAGLIYYPGDMVTKDDGSGNPDGLYIWNSDPAEVITGPAAGGWQPIA
jgi:hypothetical protein